MQAFILDMEPAHTGQTLAALCFVSMVFITAILAINALFGPSVGRLLTMILMAVQLVASNGLYPPEVQPKFVQWVHSWDPMRFSVDLMRHVLFGTLPGTRCPATRAFPHVRGRLPLHAASRLQLSSPKGARTKGWSVLGWEGP